MSKELYTYKCPDCKKVFRTDNPEEKVCQSCQKLRKPFNKSRKNKKVEKKPLTFAEISHIAEVYNRVNGRYPHYGEVVNLIDRNKGRCVCCGVVTLKDKPLCPKCERG